MKKGNLFFLIVLTALSVYLISTGVADLCAIGLVLGVILLYGWTDLLNNKGVE